MPHGQQTFIVSDSMFVLYKTALYVHSEEKLLLPLVSTRSTAKVQVVNAKVKSEAFNIYREFNLMTKNQ